MLKFLDPEARKQLRETANVGAVGLEMGLAVTVGYFLGRWLDGRFETTPYLTYFFLFIGIAAGFKGLYRAARRHAEQHRAERQRTSHDA